MNSLHFTCTYDGVVSRHKRIENSQITNEAEQIIRKFKELRGEIFELRYQAEQIAIEQIDNKRLVAEFNLVLPVIKKLSDCAEFITDREYCDWEQALEQKIKKTH